MNEVSDTVRLLQGLTLLQRQIIDELKGKLTDPVGIDVRIQAIHRASEALVQLDSLSTRLACRPESIIQEVE